jgi:uncharacterized membrane protein YkoI
MVPCAAERPLNRALADMWFSRFSRESGRTEHHGDTSPPSESERTTMKKRTKALIAAGAVVAVTAGVGTGVAVASGGEEDSSPITGAALDRASAAALAETGGGRVTETEAGDEESYYEVEVTRRDGSQVDVQLDRSFRVVGSSADDDHGGDD